MDNILTSIKKLLGLSKEYDVFDPEIIIYINATMLNLTQLGVGPDEGFIVDESSSWSDFIGDNKLLESVKQYIYLKVKLAFDPPSSSFHMDAINNMIKELEWRLNITVDK